MDDRSEKDRLADLEARIGRLKKADAPAPRTDDHHAQAHLVWRMVIELVAGIVIGFGMGYGLDVLFGTMPVFLVVFVLLGFAAGVRTMLRSAREVTAGDPSDEKGTDGGGRND